MEPTKTEQAIANLVLPRMGLWLWLSIAFAIALWFMAPHMLKVTLYKLSLITVAGYLGYWISRGLEKSGWRPHELIAKANAMANGDFDPIDHPNLQTVSAEVLRERRFQLEQLAAAAYQRRAWVIAACMIAAAIGS